MKKRIISLIALVVLGLMTAFAQTPTSRLTYQSVVRNAQNQLVINQSGIETTVTVWNADGTAKQYEETHTGLSTNANGLLTLMVGSGTATHGTWAGINWADATIQTVIRYDDVEITSGYAPVTAVPFAIQAGNVTPQVNADWNATSGVAEILNKPTIPDAQVNADWNATSGVAEILNKPAVNDATLTIKQGDATLGTFSANAGADATITIPTPTAQVQADWTETTATSAAYIQNKPTLANVATSGSYNDLTDRPTIPDAQVNADWNATSGVAQILNKPTIPAAQVNADWSATSGVAQILNKPDLSGYATQTQLNDFQTSTNNTLTGINTNITNLQTQITTNHDNIEAVQNSIGNGTLTIQTNGTTTGTFTANQATNQTINIDVPAAQVQSNWTETDNTVASYIQNKPNLANVATSGSYNDLSDKPAINNATLTIKQGETTLGTFTANASEATTITVPTPAAQVQANWTEDDNTNAAYIQNKPANLVQDASYVHTDNNYTTADKDKLAGIAAGAEVNVQSDWSQSDATADDFIKNKPAINDGKLIVTYGTESPVIFTANQAGNTEVTIPAPAAQVNADWNATSGAAQILNKPTIPTVNDATITVVQGGVTLGTFTVNTDENTTIEVPTPAEQVQANWTELDATSEAFIQNKPTIPTVNDATLTIKQGETTLGTFTANANEAATITVPTPAAQVQANWTEDDNTSAAYIQNKPTIPTTVAELTDADNYALKTGDNIFTGTNDFTDATITVPNAINDLSATLSASCTQNAVNVCDLIAVFDSLSRRISALEDIIGSMLDNLTAPTITTSEATNISKTSATVGGNLISAGTTTVNERGVCYSTTNHEPTVDDTKVVATGTGTGAFTSSLSGLTQATTYYVRAYVKTDEPNTYYGEVVTFTTSDACNGVTTISDIDGNTYNTVSIGDQCWMKENLRTKKYADGTLIPLGGSSYSTTAPYWYYPDNNATYAETYGLLYNWSAVMNGASSSSANPSGVQGICPDGWHVPSNAEWTQMVNYVSGQSEFICDGNSSNIGKALAATTGWHTYGGSCYVGNTDMATNNKTGFSALPAGMYYFGSYTGFGTFADFWTATQATDIYSNYSRTLFYNRTDVKTTSDNASYYGSSVRCVRDIVSGGGSQSYTVPTVTTSEVVRPSTTSATVGGTVTADGNVAVTERGVCWSTHATPTIGGSHRSIGSGLGSFSIELIDLTIGTTYYVRAYATNSQGTAYGEEKTFVVTTITLPAVTTSAATDINPTSATVGGNVTDDGGETVTARGICWSTSSNPTISEQYTTNGTGTGSFTANLTDLTPSTTYYARAYATTGVGTAYGEEVSFTTAAISLPTVTTSAATSINTNSAYVRGNVTADGGASVATRGICYSTSPNPTTSSNKKASGSGTGSFNVQLTGLAAGTTYYARAYATNSQGTAYGNQVTFTTLTPSIPTVYSISISNLTPTSTSLYSSANSGGGTLTASGFCYSTSNNSPTLADNFTTGGLYSYTLSGLEEGTTYYVRAYATNSAGTGYSTSYTFTTRSYTEPTVITSLSVLTSTSAKAGGIVGDDGFSDITERGVCWNTTGNPTITDNHTTLGSGTGSFYTELTGLTEGAQYYVRAYAINSKGIGYGQEMSFTAEAASIFTCGTSTVTDIEGNTYPTVQIGEQCWMKENMRSKTYADGTTILAGDYNTYDNSNPYWYYPNNDESYTENHYGLLYNWSAASKTNYDYYFAEIYTQGVGLQGICPDGWHVPSSAEWEQLCQYTSDQGYACDEYSWSTGKALAANTGWVSSTNPCDAGYDLSTNNATGFSALPAGYQSDPSYPSIGNQSTFWSASYRSQWMSPSGCPSDGPDSPGSVRCIRNDNPGGGSGGGETSQTVPTVTTNAASNITSTTATCGGIVTSDGNSAIIARGVCYGTTANPDLTGNHVEASGGFTANLTGLTPSTTYYVRAYATNSQGTAYGEQVTFTTVTLSLPIVTTSAATSINTNSAYVRGNVTDDGGASVTTRGICYSTSPNPTTSNSKKTNGSGTGNFNTYLSGLTAGTTYYARAYATNSQGTAYGNQVTFITLTPSIPTVYSISISNLTPTSTSLYSSANSGGGTLTASGFCYSTSNNSPTLADNFTTGGLNSYTLTGLEENTTYHVRAYATNSAGTGYSTSYTFTTRSYTEPTVITSLSVLTSTSAKAGGIVGDDGYSDITERGVCWNTTGNPTIMDNHTTLGSGTGSFYTELTGLTEGAQYYVRAYAINSKGIGYGQEMSFTAEAASVFTCGTSTVTDIEGNTYPTVLIGEQCWMKENMRSKTYADGTTISAGDFAANNDYSNKLWYYPNNDPSYTENHYGLLYNWLAASKYDVYDNGIYNHTQGVGVQGICPDGWHVPNDAEWDQLCNYAADQGSTCGEYSWNTGKVLAAQTGWTYNSDPCHPGNDMTTNDALGFSALPTGFHSTYNSYIGETTIFWSASLRGRWFSTSCPSDGPEEEGTVRCIRN